MRKLIKPTFDALRIATIYLVARLKVFADLAVLVAAIQAAFERVVAAHNAMIEAETRRVESGAIRDNARLVLSSVIKDFAQKVRDKSRNDFRSALYVDYFPEKSYTLHRMRADVMATKVGVIVAKLEQEPDADLKAFRDPMVGALHDFEDAIARAREAVVAEKMATGLYDTARSDWSDVYAQTHSHLRVYFHRNVRLADAFFLERPSRKVREAGEDEPEEPTPATPVEEEVTTKA